MVVGKGVVQVVRLCLQGQGTHHSQLFVLLWMLKAGARKLRSRAVTVRSCSSRRALGLPAWFVIPRCGATITCEVLVEHVLLGFLARILLNSWRRFDGFL